MTEETKPAEQPKLSPAEKLKTENDLYEQEVKRKEDLDMRMKLGGGTGGHIPAEKPKEETNKEYAERFMRGEIPLK